MITQITTMTQMNLRNQQLKICGISAAQRRGYAIVEYLLAAAAVIGAILAMHDAVAWKTLQVTVNEMNKVDGIPVE